MILSPPDILHEFVSANDACCTLCKCIQRSTSTQYKDEYNEIIMPPPPLSLPRGPDLDSSYGAPYASKSLIEVNFRCGALCIRTYACS